MRKHRRVWPAAWRGAGRVLTADIRCQIRAWSPKRDSRGKPPAVSPAIPLWSKRFAVRATRSRHCRSICIETRSRNRARDLVVRGQVGVSNLHSVAVSDEARNSLGGPRAAFAGSRHHRAARDLPRARVPGGRPEQRRGGTPRHPAARAPNPVRSFRAARGQARNVVRGRVRVRLHNGLGRSSQAVERSDVGCSGGRFVESVGVGRL